jgi:hypothetical protein
MSESQNVHKIKLLQSLPTISNQEIPVLETSPVHMLFLGRKVAATKYFSEKLSEIGQEELLHYIENCNEQIKRYLGL